MSYSYTMGRSSNDLNENISLTLGNSKCTVENVRHVSRHSPSADSAAILFFTAHVYPTASIRKNAMSEMFGYQDSFLDLFVLSMLCNTNTSTRELFRQNHFDRAMSAPCHDFIAAVLEGKLFTTTEIAASARVLQTSEAYDFVKEQWTLSDSLVEPVPQLSLTPQQISTQVNDLYVLGLTNYAGYAIKALDSIPGEASCAALTYLMLHGALNDGLRSDIAKRLLNKSGLLPSMACLLRLTEQTSHGNGYYQNVSSFPSQDVQAMIASIYTSSEKDLTAIAQQWKELFGPLNTHFTSLHPPAGGFVAHHAVKCLPLICDSDKKNMFGQISKEAPDTTKRSFLSLIVSAVPYQLQQDVVSSLRNANCTTTYTAAVLRMASSVNLQARNYVKSMLQSDYANTYVGGSVRDVLYAITQIYGANDARIKDAISLWCETLFQEEAPFALENFSSEDDEETACALVTSDDMQLRYCHYYRLLCESKEQKLEHEVVTLLQGDSSMAAQIVRVLALAQDHVNSTDLQTLLEHCLKQGGSMGELGVLLSLSIKSSSLHRVIGASLENRRLRSPLVQAFCARGKSSEDQATTLMRVVAPLAHQFKAFAAMLQRPEASLHAALEWGVQSLPREKNRALSSLLNLDEHLSTPFLRDLVQSPIDDDLRAKAFSKLVPSEGPIDFSIMLAALYSLSDSWASKLGELLPREVSFSGNTLKSLRHLLLGIQRPESEILALLPSEMQLPTSSNSEVDSVSLTTTNDSSLVTTQRAGTRSVALTNMPEHDVERMMFWATVGCHSSDVDLVNQSLEEAAKGGAYCLSLMQIALYLAHRGKSNTCSVLVLSKETAFSPLLALDFLSNSPSGYRGNTLKELVKAGQASDSFENLLDLLAGKLDSLNADKFEQAILGMTSRGSALLAAAKAEQPDWFDLLRHVKEEVVLAALYELGKTHHEAILKALTALAQSHTSPKVRSKAAGILLERGLLTPDLFRSVILNDESQDGKERLCAIVQEKPELALGNWNKLVALLASSSYEVRNGAREALARALENPNTKVEASIDLEAAYISHGKRVQDEIIKVYQEAHATPTDEMVREDLVETVIAEHTPRHPEFSDVKGSGVRDAGITASLIGNLILGALILLL